MRSINYRNVAKQNDRQNHYKFPCLLITWVHPFFFRLALTQKELVYKHWHFRDGMKSGKAFGN